MSFRPEPILDIARGLSAFTAAYILGSQVLTIYREAFVDRCGRCKGAGRVICKHCGGTKTGRRRPAEFHALEWDVVDRSPLDLYQCPHCGPMLSYDLVKDAQDNMEDAYDVMDNMKEAFAGKVRKKRMPILAGTMPCPSCLNRPRVQRHTPNFARLFKIERPPFEAVAARVGSYAGVSPLRPYSFVEYPSRPPYEDQLDGAWHVENYRANYENRVQELYEKEHPPPYIAETRHQARLPQDKPKWWGDKTKEEMEKNNPMLNKDAHYALQIKYVDDSDSEVESDGE